MTRWLTCTILFAVAWLGVATATQAQATPEASDAGETPATVERFEGIATLENGKLAYRETHEVHYVGRLPVESITRYFDGRGKKLAELRSDYRGSPFAPRYVFTGADGKLREAVDWVGNAVRFRHRSESKVVPRAEAGKAKIVLGQGLHQLVRARIDALAAGKELVVSFGIPSRMDFYEFRIQGTAAPRANVVNLSIEINDWFLRMFAPSLEVDYDKTTRRLLAYRGVSNLPGPDGEPQHVRIRYIYPDRQVAAPAPVLALGHGAGPEARP